MGNQTKLSKFHFQSPLIKGIIDCFCVVSRQRTYPVYIGNRFIDRFLNFFSKNRHIILVSTEKIVKLYPHLFKNRGPRFLFPDGEEAKNWNNLGQFLTFIHQNNATRQSVCVAIGGGSLGDSCGLAASLYHRGLRWIYCPTTLLAQGDTCLGGKTAVNFAHVKNIVGAFYPPAQVWVDLQFLKTLPPSEIRSGLVEIWKHGILKDKKLYQFFTKRSSFNNLKISDYEFLVSRSLKIKKWYVEQDEREENVRVHLNLGHTLGHAIESASHYDIPHGEAVAHGLVHSAFLSYKLGICKKKTALEIPKIAKKLFPQPKRLPPLEALIEKIHRDKKTSNGKIQFLLIKEVGSVAQRPLPISLITKRSPHAYSKY